MRSTNNDFNARKCDGGCALKFYAALKVALPRFRTRLGWLRSSGESPPLLDLCAQGRQSRIAATKLPLQTSQTTPVIVAVDVGAAKASRAGERGSTVEDSEVVED